jgi:hypothetical protein
MPEPRFCEVCSSEIPKWKSAGTIVCSVKCKFERRERRNSEAREKRSTKDKKNGLYLLHSCLTNGFNPFESDRCKCRKRLTEEQANALVTQGDAIDFTSRLPIFSFAPIVLIGKKKRTPRVATLERTHCERITEKPARAAKTKEKTIEELQAAVQRDQAERFEEEKLRLEIYGEMNAEFLRSLVREVPAEQYDNQRQEAFGRPGIFSFEEERTSHGLDVVSLGGAFDEGIEIEETEPADIEDEIEVEEQQNEDERTAEEVLAEYRES